MAEENPRSDLSLAQELMAEVLNPITDFQMIDPFSFKTPDDFVDFFNNVFDMTDRLLNWTNLDSDDPEQQQRLRQVKHLLGRSSIAARQPLQNADTAMELWAIYPLIRQFANDLTGLTRYNNVLIEEFNQALDEQHGVLNPDADEADQELDFNQPAVWRFMTQMDYVTGIANRGFADVKYFATVLAILIMNRFEDWETLRPGKRLTRIYQDMNA